MRTCTKYQGAWWCLYMPKNRDRRDQRRLHRRKNIEQTSCCLRPISQLPPPAPHYSSQSNHFSISKHATSARSSPYSGNTATVSLGGEGKIDSASRRRSILLFLAAPREKKKCEKVVFLQDWLDHERSLFIQNIFIRGQEKETSRKKKE